MSTATETELTFSPDSVEFRDRILGLIRARLKKLAIEKVRSEHRSDVTQEDFRACVKDAVEQVVKEVVAEAETRG